ncbi:MAG: murein biosynthesis integral membrane protein MurJ [Oligoflexia bacterium]|nr:murein biosynthesis integral membrane protein MurJ [Oligoflexia bacterium]
MREKSSGILRSSLTMSAATFASRILGLVREQVMAMIFGASYLTDAFLVAYRIPNLLRDLLAEGAFSAAFVPIFTEVRKRQGEAAAKELLWSIAILLFLITGLVGLLIYIFSPALITFFAPSFSSNAYKFNIAVILTRIMSGFLLCVSLAALFMGVLNSLKVFFVPALAPAGFNVVMVISCLLLPNVLERYGLAAIYALGIGVLLGGICQVGIQIPLLLKYQHGPFWPRQLLSPVALRVIRRLGPGLIGFAAGQINLLVTTILASGIVGAVSWLNYAFRLFQFPVGIVGVSVANSHLVHFSDAVKGGEMQRAKELLSISYHLILSMLLPATTLLFFLAEEITNIVFQRGKYTAFDTLMTADVLRLYALGLPFYGIYKLMVPTFYALDKQKIPIIITVTTIAVNILFCLYFIDRVGFRVLAIGTTLTMLLNSLLLLSLVQEALNLELNFFYKLRILKFVVAAGISAIFVRLLSLKFFFFNEVLLIKVGKLLVLLLLGGVFYLILLLLFREEELCQKTNRGWKKLRTKFGLC